MRTPTLLAAALCAVLVACGGDNGTPTDSNGFTNLEPPANGRAEFTYMPVDLTEDGTIEPLGHLQPSGHTLPTDHVYFYPINYDVVPNRPDTISRNVYAPAAGTLMFMINDTNGDAKIMFRATKNFYWYLDHVRPNRTFKLGDVVQAGEKVGLTGPGAAIDLGAFDMGIAPLPFVNPNRVAGQTAYCVNPFKYFVEPLKSTLYARQRRVKTADPEAPIVFDQPGKLIGQWFEVSVPNTPDASEGPIGWLKSLAFVYDNRDPSLPRLSIGGTISSAFLGTIPDDAPRFENVTPASGKVGYSIRYQMSTNIQWGYMLVQMVAPDKITVEVFPGETAKATEFTAAAHTYVR